MELHKTQFSHILDSDHTINSVLLSAEQIAEIVSIHSSPCPDTSGAERQRYYRIRQKYTVRTTQSCRLLYTTSANKSTELRVLAKEEMFDVFQQVHSEGGKHLGRDRLLFELKKRYFGFSKATVQAFVKFCQECQLKKSKKSLKSTVVKPIQSPDFASRGQVDLIDLQNTDQINRPYSFLLVYQDHHTKFVVLRPLTCKSAEEVSKTLFEIFCFIGPPHILQSDNGKEFKNVNLSMMIRDLWPGCKIVHGKPRHPQSQGSVERVNREIKHVLGSLMRESQDTCWVKYIPIVQHSINTSPHSTLEGNSPYRILFGREPVRGMEDFGIPDEIAADIVTEVDMITILRDANEMENESLQVPENINQQGQSAIGRMSPITSVSAIVDYDSESMDSLYEQDPIGTVFRDIDYPQHLNILVDQPSKFCSQSSVVHVEPVETIAIESCLPSSSTPCLQTESQTNISPLMTTVSYPISITLPLPDTFNSDPLEPHCIVCDNPCSWAHSCPECKLPVHSICGHAVEGKEGFGSPVYCNHCWLNKREVRIQTNKNVSKRGQSRQIDRMVKQTLKKVRMFDVGDNILLTIPEVDKRSPFDPPNLPGIILHRTEDGFIGLVRQQED